MVYLIRQAPVRASIETPTPLEDITSYFPGAKGRILAKVEGKYPNTSVKDRIAEQMLDDAEADGIITPSELPIDKQTGLWLPNKHGNIITEGTSGNTGFGLVNSGIPRGYRVVLAIPQKMDPYKVQLLRAYGASVIVVPTDAAHGSPESYTGVAERLAFELNGFFTNQHNNPSNSLAHYRTTGPEIYMQTDGKVTYLVAGSGTGGTISGTGRFLKEKNPTLKVIGVDPVGSPLQFIFDYYRAHARLPTKDEIKPHDGAYKVEGIGMDHKTGNTDLDLIDEFLKVADRQAFGEAKSFYLKSRLTVGGSSGAALAAVRQLVPRLTESDTVVVILPDDGKAYLNRFLDPIWMNDNDLERKEPERTIEQLVNDKPLKFQDILFATPDQTVGDIVAKMEKIGISQMPLVKDDDWEYGSVLLQILKPGLVDGTYGKDLPISEAMKKDEKNFRPFPTLPIGASRKDLEHKLFRDTAVLITQGTKVINILTAADQLELV